MQLKVPHAPNAVMNTRNINDIGLRTPGWKVPAHPNLDLATAGVS
jgi:hypothetical protein